MTFTENLESAKGGNKRAYGMLCNEYADHLYAVAFLVLDNAEDAENVLKNAFEDGFGSINRINDGNHLCAWLSRELTKHIVAKLKEYRAENRNVTGGNIPEKEMFCRLNDLDRLVCALNLAFGYKTKELSVITGLKEETVERKLNDSARKLGNNKSAVQQYIEKVSAPDSLITKAPKVHDLTVEIDHFDDDGLIGEMERIAAIAEAEEHGGAVAEEPKNPRLIRFQPASLQDEGPEKPAEPVKAEEETAKAVEFPSAPAKAEEISAEPVPVEPVKAEEKPAEPETKAENFPKIEFASPENPVEKDVSEVKEEPEPKTEEKAETPVSQPKKEIDARTFINVITAQKIKGSEFLKLMGNTRISNSAYREIEQNPGLTKDRLVELLEQSPLTSEDYYKLLTAVKQRQEMLSKKQEAERRHEQAGLFSINRKEETVTPEPDVDLTDTQAFAANDLEKKAPPQPVIKIERAEEPKKEEPKPRLEPKSADEKPFTPQVKIEADENDGKKDFDPYATAVIAPPINPPKKETPAPKPEPKPEPPQPKKESPLVQPKAEVDDDDRPYSPDAGKREKYKGREYFIDDDVYYPGVNNGKIAFCAVCAVLLIAGSFGIRYLTTGSFLPTDNPAAINRTEEAKLPAEYLSDQDIYTALSMLETAETRVESGYYRSDNTPYTEVLTKDVCEAGDLIYIHRDGRIICYNLAQENPNEFTEFSFADADKFIGFTATSENLWLFFEDEYEETVEYTVTTTADDGTVSEESKTKDIKRSFVKAECYTKEFDLISTYKQDGDFAAVTVNDESLSLATVINTSKTAVSEASATFLPSYSLDENKEYIKFDAITVPEGINCNSFTVIGTVSGGEVRASAVLGGTDGYVSFEGEKCRTVIPDKNKTFVLDFRFIGSNLSLETTAVYEGECYGTEFIKGTDDIVAAYDSENKCVVIQKKAGEEIKTLSGIGAYETLKGVSYTDKYAYIVTETVDKATMLYCVDTNGSEFIAVDTAPDAVYTEKLKEFGDNLIGVTVEADEGGNRTGIKLAVYSYDGKLTEQRNTIITLDENTASEYLRYLSADAEISNLRIATDETSTYAAVSTVYFDGISEIERILCFKDDGTALNVTTDLLLFDIQSDYRVLTIRGNVLYIITDGSVITADAETGDPMGYFNDETQPAAPENAETEETTIE